MNQKQNIIIIGRNEEKSDLVLPYPTISHTHARLIKEGNQITIEDINSRNGIFVNGVMLPKNEEIIIKPEDDVRLSSYPIKPYGLQIVQMTDSKITIGRTDKNEVAIPYPNISTHHAVIFKEHSDYYIQDLNSSEGTYVNGRRIDKTKITSKDTIYIASYQLRFNPTRKKLAIFSPVGGSHLTISHLYKVVRDSKSPTGKKLLLDDISFRVHSGDFVGLIGPSGAGKTTLLRALCGLAKPDRGLILLDDEELYSNYENFKTQIGYAPQDDIVHPELTVEESLIYTARLRFAQDVTNEEIKENVSRVLKELDIEGTRHIPIKKISGGQRKRVNLAQELLNPSTNLLFLDEPTSGLDPNTDAEVMELLSRLADDGRTIIVVTHSITPSNIEILEKVAVLAPGGKLAYYGSPMEACSYFEVGHPANIFKKLLDKSPKVKITESTFLKLEDENIPTDTLNKLKTIKDKEYQDEDKFTEALETIIGKAQIDKYKSLILKHSDKSRTPDEWKEKYLNSPHFKKYVKTQDVESAIAVRPPKREMQKPKPASFIRQWWTLTQRYGKIKMRDTTNLAILLIQPVFIALLMLSIFEEVTIEFLFILSFAALWFGCSSSVRELIGERAIYKREKMVNLRSSTYISSKLAILILFDAIQCLILLSVFYVFTLIVKSKGFSFFDNEYGFSFVKLWGVLTITSFVGTTVGLLISALFNSSEAAVGTLLLFLIPQILYSGVIIPFGEMPFESISNFMISRWSLEASIKCGNKVAKYDEAEKKWYKESHIWVFHTRLKMAKDLNVIRLKVRESNQTSAKISLWWACSKERTEKILFTKNGYNDFIKKYKNAKDILEPFSIHYDKKIYVDVSKINITEKLGESANKDISKNSLTYIKVPNIHFDANKKSYYFLPSGEDSITNKNNQKVTVKPSFLFSLFIQGKKASFTKQEYIDFSKEFYDINKTLDIYTSQKNGMVYVHIERISKEDKNKLPKKAYRELLRHSPIETSVPTFWKYLLSFDVENRSCGFNFYVLSATLIFFALCFITFTFIILQYNLTLEEKFIDNFFSKFKK